ncbi:N-acetylglucosamine kinase [Nonomuraea sp. NPDC002799]
MRMVLGIDAGGTSSRAALFTVAGETVGRGLAGGGNPGAVGMDAAAANLTAAVRAAGASVADFEQVSAVVAGVAGNPGRCLSLVERVLRPVLRAGVPVRSAGDIVTAFAAGTAAPSGTVLISGTGAVAAKIIDYAAVAAADGFGWQLGDEGSAFWVGRAAARTTIRTLAAALHAHGAAALHAHDAGSAPAAGPDRAAPPGGVLAELVVRRLLPDGPGDDPVADLAAAVHARPPLALAELAPLVSRAARAGDPAAVEIVAEAASLLVRTALEVHDPGRPIVLSGSVLTAAGPVRQAVQDLLPDAVTAGDAAGAAAWLAARTFLDPRTAERRHARFVEPIFHRTSSAALP